MTDTTQAPQEPTDSEPTNAASASSGPASRPARRTSGGALGGKVIAELQEIAAELGIEGANTLRKGALIDAIKAARGETPKDAPAAERSESAAEAPKAARAERAPKKAAGERPARQNRAKQDGNKQDSNKQDGADASAEASTEQQDRAAKQDRAPKQDRGPKQDRSEKQDRSDKQDSSERSERGQGRGQQGNGSGGNNAGGQAKQQNGQSDQKSQGNQAPQGGGNQNGSSNQGPQDDDEAGGRRRNRRGRGRGGRAVEGDVQVAEDDVLVPAAGIVDILDNYAFVRTTGYLPSENDVYVSLSMVRKWGLRRGDAVVGQVRQPREGERKEKFNPMVRVDSVNGMTLEEAKQRSEFEALTPVFPTQRLRLETDQHNVVGRVVDLFAPIGKGQRALLVAPPAAGKTSVLRQLAASVTANNPECHLMIVLVDERPEEVTEFQRSVKGEVISSAFDRPAGDHTTVAELAIERAKRLVELGHDVVVLLDGITRLGRAYNQAAAGQGRVLADGIDASALFAPKHLLGAARNLEDGGSLTIVATALIETGSRIDELILGEVRGTVTTELRLDGDAASKRQFPAIDPVASSTRHDDLLQSTEELDAARAWRRELAELAPAVAVTAVLERIGSSASNAEVVRRLV